MLVLQRYNPETLAAQLLEYVEHARAAIGPLFLKASYQQAWPEGRVAVGLLLVPETREACSTRVQATLPRQGS